MIRGMAPIVVILVLLASPLFSTRSSQDDPEYLWLTVYTYDVPAKTLIPGEHSYEFRFDYTSPRRGELTGEPHNFTLSEEAPLYRAFALLRPNGLQALVDTPDGTACEVVKTLNPDQNLRFMVLWVPDEKLTRSEQSAHLQSMTAEIRIDGGSWQVLDEQVTTLSWQPLWNCQPWIREGGSLAALVQPAG